MAAFERAVALGYRYLETDVRVTADGVALAFHDSTLDRVTDQCGRVADLPWAQVRRARIDGRERIPVLAELLDAWPDTYVNIDI
ncbi:MAG: glycerophosphoryl diester phosphodiesterase, partial [Pseudonocardiales bacterium]|nr:glycerophosphoryl diester phosphodiesterase [Pseudonocardiales bacterium]